MKNRVISLFIALSLIFSVFGVSILLSSCATSQRTYQAGAARAGLGVPTGTLIDRENRWRGGVLGAATGGVLVGTTTEISQRAAAEAAQEGHPVIYQSNDGYQRIIEESPISYNVETKCHKVRERIWQERQLVKDEVKEVC